MTALFLLVLIGSIWLIRQSFLLGDEAVLSNPTTPDFFFQAEDGIRYVAVTGVQTCALPICPTALRERERAREQGGLSGRPLFKLSTRMLAETFVRAEGAFALVGVGGIDSGATAIAKIKAGATLLQLYTGMVYRGIGVVNEIKADLASAIRRGYRNSLASMVGNDAATITAESWPG